MPNCSDCGRFIEPEQAGDPCPDCGSGDRQIFVYESGEAREALGLKAKDSEGFRLFERKQCEKLSDHGHEARESLVYDHRDPRKTVKTHIVEERTEDGAWRVVHDEVEEYPAKRRPKEKAEETDKNI